MFIKGYTVPGVRLDLGLTQDTREDSSKGWNSIRNGCNQKNTGEPIYKGICS